MDEAQFDSSAVALSRRALLLGAGGAAAFVAGSLALGDLPAFADEGSESPDQSHPEVSHPECGGGEVTRAAGWGGHANGKIPSDAMIAVPATVGGFLRADAAVAYQALSSAFAKQFGKSLSITEGYRDFARQQYLYDGWVNHRPGFNLAAPPGTSKHGWATACDFGSGVNSYGSAEKSWTDANGPIYGWIPTGNGFSPREAWHFEFNGAYTPGSGVPGPNPEGSDEDMFKIIKAHETDHVYIVGPAKRVRIGSPGHVNLLQRFQKGENLLTVEIDICLNYVRQVY